MIERLTEKGWTKEITYQSKHSGPAVTMTNQSKSLSIRVMPNPTNGKPYFRVYNLYKNPLNANGVFPSWATRMEMRELTHFYFY